LVYTIVICLRAIVKQNGYAYKNPAPIFYSEPTRVKFVAQGNTVSL